jgi:hypothetical protein
MLRLITKMKNYKNGEIKIFFVSLLTLFSQVEPRQQIQIFNDTRHTSASYIPDSNY